MVVDDTRAEVGVKNAAAGSFAIDTSSQIVPGSFGQNPEHLWISPETGTSSILWNRHFYDWLHAPERT
jgi:hypothetical protein